MEEIQVSPSNIEATYNPHVHRLAMASFTDLSGAWSCATLVWNRAFPVLLLHRRAGADIQDASEATGGETD